MRRTTYIACMAMVIALSSTAHAGVGMGLRVGTLGYGGDLDIGIVEKLNVRIGYTTYSYSNTIEDTDVTYDGDLKLSNAALILDWHPMAGAFRLSIGAVGPGLTADVQGKPTAGGTYEIGDGTYTAAQIGRLNGELKFGNSTAPYIGLGWGSAVDKDHRVTFHFDLGAAYIGKSEVNLSVTCGATLNATQCATLQSQLRSDLAMEQQELEEGVGAVEWWPVIQFGLGVRFK